MECVSAIPLFFLLLVNPLWKTVQNVHHVSVPLHHRPEELKKRGEVVPEEYLPHITPLGWEHINLIGQYSFSHQSARSLNNLQPLRLPEQGSQETQEVSTEDRGVSSLS